MRNVTAVLSMLHEPSDRNSSTRTFRDEPVLAWTLERLSRAKHLGNMAVLCWEDQLESVRPIAEEHSAYILSKDPRIVIAGMESITAARRWSQGWRGGLLGSCDFDLGFHAPWVGEIVQRLESDGVLLVDPSAGLVDSTILDQMIEHAGAREAVQICFTQAAPGLAGVLLKPGLLEQLAAAKMHLGRILSYLPDQPVRDPISGDGCMPVPSSIARTTRSFKLDSARQIARITEAAISLNGELLASDAEGLLQRLAWSRQSDALPQEIVIELNTRRLCSPIFWPGSYHKVDRSELSPELAEKVFEELAQADDARITLAGVGDPLLHPEVFQIIDAARRAGIRAIHIETDLLVSDAGLIDQLVDSRVDIVSAHVPAMNAQTYHAVMGVEGLAVVLENMRRFVTRRQQRGAGVPLIVPYFTKCQGNLAELEAWYDQWLNALGCAVISGPSDFCGQVPDCAVADMSPTKRRACARLDSRLTMLSDGRAVSCEQDVTARQVLGDLRFDSLAIVWNSGMQALRQTHERGRFDSNPLCAACREWHRP